MPTIVQFRRGTAAQNNAFTGAAGELSVDSSLNTIRVHDGTTVGGTALLVAADSIAYDYNFTGTTTSTTPTAVTAFATATYRSGKLVMQVVNGSTYRILELLVLHDGTNVTLSENYANANEIQTATTNTTFTASIATGTLTVYAAASSGTSVIKGHATLFKV